MTIILKNSWCWNAIKNLINKNYRYLHYFLSCNLWILIPMHYEMGGNLTHKLISLAIHRKLYKNIYCKYCKYAIEFSQIYLQLQYAIHNILLHCNLFAISLWFIGQCLVLIAGRVCEGHLRNKILNFQNFFLKNYVLSEKKPASLTFIFLWDPWMEFAILTY